MISMASCVLPQPALPQTNEALPRGSPPPVISSNPEMPVRHLAIPVGKRAERFTERRVTMAIPHLTASLRSARRFKFLICKWILGY
jgi:hypothetical protein